MRSRLKIHAEPFIPQYPAFANDAMDPTMPEIVIVQYEFSTFQRDDAPVDPPMGLDVSQVSLVSPIPQWTLFPTTKLHEPQPIKDWGDLVGGMTAPQDPPVGAERPL